MSNIAGRCPTAAEKRQRKEAGHRMGVARARNLTQERRVEIAEQGGGATLAKYGHAYFRHINPFTHTKECKHKHTKIWTDAGGYDRVKCADCRRWLNRPERIKQDHA